ncbi:MAG: hypothetical protein ABJD07_04445, partial [Gemmatimonadaceae bacterium]
MSRMVRVSICVLLGGAASAASAQNVGARVAAARDGSVLLTFAARAGVCGDGKSYIGEMLSAPDGFTMYSVDGGYDVINIGSGGRGNMSGTCVPGPVRVVLTVENRKVTAVRPYVGPVTSKTSGVGTDLGAVAAAEAADYLLALSTKSDERAGRYAMLAAAMADSARLEPKLAAIARDRDVLTAVRERALHWLAVAGERDDDKQV